MNSNLSNLSKYFRSSNITIFLIFIGVVFVFYFSWLDSPRFSLNSLVPDWIAKWADKHDNDNTRTAIPLILLGTITGLYLIFKRLNLKWWIISWLLFVAIVFIAEAGQLLLPLRSFDLKDIIWGALGSASGLLFMYFIKPVYYKIKRN